MIEYAAREQFSLIKIYVLVFKIMVCDILTHSVADHIRIYDRTPNCYTKNVNDAFSRMVNGGRNVLNFDPILLQRNSIIFFYKVLNSFISLIKTNNYNERDYDRDYNYGINLGNVIGTTTDDYRFAVRFFHSTNLTYDTIDIYHAYKSEGVYDLNVVADGVIHNTTVRIANSTDKLSSESEKLLFNFESIQKHI